MYNKKKAYGAAPNALFFVSDLIAAKVLVMTATNRLISQKLRTIMATIKKKHEIKNSASIIWYMSPDHYDSKVSFDLRAKSLKTYPIRRCNDNNLQCGVIDSIKTLEVILGI